MCLKIFLCVVTVEMLQREVFFSSVFTVACQRALHISKCNRLRSFLNLGNRKRQVLLEVVLLILLLKGKKQETGQTLYLNLSIFLQQSFLLYLSVIIKCYIFKTKLLYTG